VRSTENRFHIVFGSAAQNTLIETLRSVGREEMVVAYPDDLSVGPIDGESAAERAEWMVQEFGPPCAGFRALPTELEAFWGAFRSANATPVIWFTRRSARDYSGFLELLRHLTDAPCQIVDLSGDEFVTRKQPDGPGQLKIFLSLGEMPPPVLPSVQILSPLQRDRYRQIWSILRTENAPFRVLADGGLDSAPISFFDDTLLSAASSDWQKIARTIGEFYFMSLEDNALAVDDRVLAGRIRALVAVGALECRGNIDNIRAGEIRHFPAPACSAVTG
jgi:Protein of unknown function/Domain of unknown function (DUF1835)